MKKIVIITPPDTGAGFRLAGVTQYTVDRDEGLPAILAELIKDPECGLMVIDERLLDEATEQKVREMETKWQGVVVTLPAPGPDATAGEDHAAGLLRKAIGYHVRLSV